MNQHEIMDFTWKSWTLHVETGSAPHISKSHLRACGSGCLAWPTSARGVVFFNWNCQKTKWSSIWQFQKYMAVAAGWAGLTCSWPQGHESVGCRQLGIETIPSRCCLNTCGLGGGPHHIYQPWSGLDYRRFINRRSKQKHVEKQIWAGALSCPII